MNQITRFIASFEMATATISLLADANSPQNGMASRPPPSTYQTLEGLIRSHASEDHEIPMVGYPDRGVDDYVVHTAKMVDRYVDAACWWYQEQGLRPAVRACPQITDKTSKLIIMDRIQMHMMLPWWHC